LARPLETVYPKAANADATKPKTWFAVPAPSGFKIPAPQSNEPTAQRAESQNSVVLYPGFGSVFLVAIYFPLFILLILGDNSKENHPKNYYNIIVTLPIVLID
jgi:hypothetical protein